MGLTNDECEELQQMLEAIADNRGALRGDRERQFVDDQIKRWDEHGADMRLSPAQWRWLNDIYGRIIDG